MTRDHEEKRLLLLLAAVTRLCLRTKHPGFTATFVSSTPDIHGDKVAIDVCGPFPGGNERLRVVTFASDESQRDGEDALYMIADAVCEAVAKAREPERKGIPPYMPPSSPPASGVMTRGG